MKICIVGGTGNISLPIVRLLLEQGHDVTTYNRNQKGETVAGAKLIIGDRKDREYFESEMKAGHFDAAIDVICFDREDALCDIRAFADVSHFIQVSTVCTYGIDYDYLPVTEDHPLRPITDYGKNKVAADNAFLEAYYRDGFPVTIIKPCHAFGPQMGLLRQVAWDCSWLHRVETGRPILILGEGLAAHQFLHVDDAAPCFAGVLGRNKCIGQTYNMVDRGFTTWKTWHETAMKIIGKEVEFVGITQKMFDTFKVPGGHVAPNMFAYNCYYSNDKLLRDVPEFNPQFSLEEGMRDVYLAMRESGSIPESEKGGWEDRIIERLLR